jgi:hypothetical protein
MNFLHALVPIVLTCEVCITSLYGCFHRGGERPGAISAGRVDLSSFGRRRRQVVPAVTVNPVT